MPGAEGGADGWDRGGQVDGGRVGWPGVAPSSWTPTGWPARWSNLAAAGLAAVVEAFGPGVLAPDGGLDRAALGRLVFADDAARLRLNAILHPLIAARTAELFAGAPADAIVVHDVPLLVENRMGAAYHLVLVVHAEVEERVRRLTAERGMPQADARARIAAQADDDAPAGRRRCLAGQHRRPAGRPGHRRPAVGRATAARSRPTCGHTGRRHARRW